MSTRTVDIKIKTTADNAGIDNINKSLGTLESKQNSATKSGKALTDQTQSFGSKTSQAAGMVGQLSAGLGASGGAAGKFGGAMGFAGAAVSGLSGGIGGLLTVLAAGAIGAWVKWNNKVEESKEALKKFKTQIDENKLAIQQTEVSNLSTFYTDLTAAIDQASAAQAKLNQAMAAADSVEKAERMALLDLGEKQALNKISPGDSLSRSETSASFATQRRELDQEFQERSAKRVAETMSKALEDAVSKERIAETAIMSSRRKLGEISDQQSSAQSDLGALYTTKKPMKDNPLYYGSRSGFYKTDEPTQIVDKKTQKAEADSIKEKLYGEKGLEAQYKELAKSIGDLSRQLEANRIETEAAKMNAVSAVRQYDSISNTNPLINNAETKNDLLQNRYGREQEISTAQSKYADILKKREELQKTSRKEMGDYRKAANSFTASDDTLKKERDEAVKALEAVKQYSKDNAAILSQLTETMQKNREALKNLPGT